MCCTTKEIKIAYNIDEGFGCYGNALRKCLLYARNSVRGVVSQFEIDFVPKLGDTYYMFAANFNNPTIAISMESRLVLCESVRILDFVRRILRVYKRSYQVI